MRWKATRQYSTKDTEAFRHDGGHSTSTDLLESRCLEPLIIVLDSW